MTNPPTNPVPPPSADRRPAPAPNETQRNRWRIGECLILFFALPIFYAVAISRPGLLFPALWVAAFLSLGALLLDRRRFDRRALGLGTVAPAKRWRELRLILLRFGVLALLLGLAVGAYDRWFNPGEPLLFGLPRRNLVVWGVVMVGYPIASVYPQELIWRPLFFHRYGPALDRPLLRAIGPVPAITGTIAASALSFGLVHILFGHWLSVLLTAVGGVLFAGTYARTRSTLLASVEHALYGCFAFTIGIGGLFYSGGGGG